MARATPTLLVCGFGPFPGAAHNPAGRIVARLAAARWAPAGAGLATWLIPTTWAGAHDALALALAQHPPDGVLLVGVAGGTQAFRVESRAHNRILAERPDAAGDVHPVGPISPDGPPLAAVTAPVGAMLAALADAGLPAEPSDDAGDYLCNFTLYRLLTDYAGPAGFLHIPPEGPAFPLDELERGVKAVAGAFASALAPRLDRPSAA